MLKFTSKSKSVMKLKVIQIFLLVYIVVMLAKFSVKQFLSSNYISLKPVFDGILVGLVIICLLYYARIYITAWIRVKKEEKQKSTGA
ncbi:hypothetical protein JN11_01329 [Mucilaginibacter frigoritolerans]|uniref:Uncharacterized protein n=2 Tax=Mucilaginibacter frigoritolerans TaxID=652788 RepID=A0A562UAE5_9SPHI|nr:hypothetical protein JN11_01329 [Mucilaginibacter frigoritolerans]